MKQIPLTQGQVALVDDEDFLFLSQWKWYAHKTKWGYYAARSSRTSDSLRHSTIFTHRVIMNTSENMEVDHKDRNRLNNQKLNLRNCTRSENNMNSSLDKDSSTGYKGVSKDGKSFRAKININRKCIRLGTFDTPELAALAYNNKAVELFGEFANLNVLK